MDRGDALTDLSASALAALFAAGELSPVEAATSCLEQIERADPALHAFCFLQPERTLADARLSERRWAASDPLGRFDGVPVAVKDTFFTKGWPTLKASKTIDPAGPWADDAPAVARLREQGAVIVGKTSTPEYAWKAVTDSPSGGITRNPWDTALTPAGSSGGSAVAPAARMAPVALGTAAGGSLAHPPYSRACSANAAAASGCGSGSAASSRPSGASSSGGAHACDSSACIPLRPSGANARAFSTPSAEAR